MKAIMAISLFSMVLSGFLILLTASEALSLELKAGASKKIITPQMSVYLAGLGDEPRISNGVHDDIYARCLLLDENSGSVA